MGSSRYYRVWLWDGAAWQEVTRFTGMQMDFTLNFVPSFSATFYLVESALQDLMVARTPFRITNTTSPDGLVETGLLGQSLAEVGATAGSREIMTGLLDEPSAKQKTAVRNGKPVIWEVDGAGFTREVMSFIRDDDTPKSSTAGGTVISDYIDEVNARSAGSIDKGTIDTGPTISVKHRKDNLFGAMLDIAQLGDATNQFTYYIYTDTTDYDTPRVHYLSPENALFDTTDPFDTDGLGTRDEGRIIDEEKEVVDYGIINELDRILNAIQVRYQGVGTGSSQQQHPSSGFDENSTSITNFGRQEGVTYAQWVQDSATANVLADTALNMFGGEGTFGIRRVEAMLRTAELFTNDFDAVPGDQVGFESAAGEVVQGRFLGFSYDQDSERLIIRLGLPRVHFFENMSDLERQMRQAYNSIEITETALATETTPASTAGTAIVSDSDVTNRTATEGGGTAEYEFGVPVGNEDDFADHIYMIRVGFRTTGGFSDGPILVEVTPRDSLNNELAGEPILRETVGPLAPGNVNPWNRVQGIWPFAFQTSGNNIDHFLVRFTNDGDTGSGSNLGANTVTFTEVSLRVNSMPQHAIDLSHTHPL